MMMLLGWILGCASTPSPDTVAASVDAAQDVAGAESETKRGVSVVLDGQTIAANWDDGDTFSARMPTDDGGFEKLKGRLVGFNTLESYGPVHRWGDWTAEELAGIAKAAGERARGTQWVCSKLEGSGGYGRSRVDCPALRQALLQEGLAHLFVMDDEASAEDLAMQAKAIQDGAGMWAKGAPQGIVTSLHSLDERPDQEETYDRVVSTETGKSEKFNHADNYESCQEVCRSGSCLTYVPYQMRYGENRAACLREPTDP